MAEALEMVYFSQGGRKYHRVSDCPAMISARRLWGDDPDDYPFSSSRWGRHPVWRWREVDAYYQSGKRPCLVCLPGRGVPFASACDFGHRPAEHVVQGRVVGTVCLRCRIAHRRDEWQVDGDIIRATGFSLVKWPCTSARVLGVADQPVSSQTLGMVA